MLRRILAFIAFFAMAGYAVAAVNAPSGVTAAGLSDTSVRVNWVDNSTNEDGFNVYRSNQQGAGFVKIGSVAADVTEFVDDTLAHPMTRHYRVVAFKASVHIPEDLSDISNGAAGSTISSVPQNQNPLATDNSYTVQRDQQVMGNVITDAPADSDPDGGTLSVQPISNPNLSLLADGSFTFTPPADTQVLSMMFDYTLEDGQGGSDIAAVTFDITEPPLPPNEPPVAVDDFNAGLVDVAIEGNVLPNDTDPEGDILTVKQPNAAIASNGTYSITRSVAGIYNFPYTVQDGQGGEDDGNLQLTVTEPQPTGPLVAFPGAEGYGRFAQGGRGGAVMFVTNLNDSGAGSLRACVEATGPRNCIFRVGGTIQVDDAITQSAPFLTIAGETAPGMGILVRNTNNNLRQTLRIWSHDTIIRHLRLASGGPPHNVSSNGDSILISGIGTLETSDNISNIMVDHSALFFATDENFDVSPWYDGLSIQNSIVARGLKPHSKGPNFRGCGVSMVDNLIADNTIRNPNNTCGKEIPGSVRGGGSKSGQTEFRNNVVSNGVQGYFDMFNGRGEGWANVAGNVFIRGPETVGGNNAPYSVDVREVTSVPQLNDNGCPGGANCANWKPAGTTDPQHICVQDNAEIGDVSGSRTPPVHGVMDPRDATAINVTGGTPVLHSTDCVNNPASDPTEGRGLTGDVRDADADPIAARDEVLADVGPFYWNRDTVTADIVADVVAGTGSVPTCTPSGNLCSGLPYPTLAGGTPYPDADNDGMDDAWEAANGVTNPNGDIDGDGYTNLEEFLHELATR